MIFSGKKVLLQRRKVDTHIVKKANFLVYQYHNSFICNNALNFDVVSRGDDDREQSNPTFLG